LRCSRSFIALRNPLIGTQPNPRRRRKEIPGGRCMCSPRARTFSAGEGLAFLLQERHCAEVVGETTAGAANPGKSCSVNDRFSVTVPNGRVRSAIGGGNWEGTGVAPNVTTTAAQALQVAYARAIRTLIARQPAGPWRDALEQLLADR